MAARLGPRAIRAWASIFDGRPGPTAACSTVLLLLVAAIRLVAGDPAQGVVGLYVVPIALTAASLGTVPGLFVGAAAYGLFLAGNPAAHLHVDPLGYAVRILSFGAVAVAVGESARRSRDAGRLQRDLFASAPCGFHSLGPDGRFLAVNATELGWLGYRRDEVVGKLRITDVLTPHSVAVLRDRLAVLVRDGAIDGVELELVARDGTVVEVVAAARAIYDSRGEVVRTYATLFDDRARRAADEARRLLASIVESTDDAIVSTTLDGEITSWNAGARELFGHPAEDVLGRSMAVITPPDREAERVANLRRVASGERVEHHDTVGVRRDGSAVEVSVTISPMFDANSRIVGASVIARDITARRRAEQRFHQLVEFAPDAVVGVNAAGRIELVNSQVEAMFGYGRDELLGAPLESLVPSRLRWSHAGHRARYFEQPSHRQMGVGLQLPARRKDGTEFPCEVSLSVIDGGELAIAAVRDVSERRRLQAEADRAKAEFFALVSHELRTPLTSIAGFSELLLDEQDGFSADARHFVDVIRRNTHRLDRLVQDILLVAQLDAGTFDVVRRDVDLADLARASVDAFAPAAEAAGVRLSLAVGAVDPLVGDPTRLGQVIDNLVSNAVKFTPAGGTVQLRVDQDDDRCVVEVADSGAGIEPHEVARLYDRFYRGSVANERHIKGVGLGLAITKAIVDLHDGTIDVDSTPGRGSTFRVALPRHRSPRALVGTAAVTAGTVPPGRGELA